MDPLDWTHQWENFEMMMYVEAGDDAGIRMQVARKTAESAAESWEVLYDRKVADVPDDVQGTYGSEAWEEAVLRQHLNTHPQLVNEEKAYLASILAKE